MNTQQIATRFTFFMLACFTMAVAPACAQIITHVPTTFQGDSEGDRFGRAVSGVGDVNGDGVPDLIVGVQHDDNNGINSGSARVLSGADGSVLYNFDGDSENDNFGRVVNGAGDVNGDGFNDLIAGGNGDISVFSGADGSVLFDIAFGHQTSVNGAGDVNGDGFDDIITFSFSTSFVFSGVDRTPLYNFPDLSFSPRFVPVNGAGDVNGDGFDDLIVGSLGNAQVFSGVDGSVLHSLLVDSLDTDRFRRAVSGAGDVNGDGFDDLIVGARLSDNNGQNSGSAHVFSGVDGNLLYTFDGDARDDWFGWSVSSAGDVNGDGFDDLIVGAVLDSSIGRYNGSARVLSGADGSILYNFDGDSPSDFFGHSVSGVGDVNGDGLADFFVGASGGGANNGGYARLFVSQITLLGDCDLNGEVNFSDIPSFIDILQMGDYVREADINQDDVVDFSDIPRFIEILIAI